MEQKRKKQISRQQSILLLVCIAMLLAAAACFGAWWWLSRLLASQREAERWQGDGEMPFKQISCFLPMNEMMTLEQIATFRSAAMTRLKESSLDVSGDAVLMMDCWSTNGTVNVKGEHGKGEAAVIAVGGNYFNFHPIRLLNGDYLHPDDLMQDRVLLDEELSWLLFGGTNLQGKQLTVNGIPYVVAGVIERETDFATRKAYSGEMGMFMSYEGLRSLDENLKIDCYEYVLANPVKDFAVNAAREKFPIKHAEILCNTDRYQYDKLMMDIVLKYGSRSTHASGILYPYWENAARITEDWAALCCLLGTLLPIFPAIVGTVWLVRAFRRGRKKMAEEILPEAKEKTEEAIRVRQRKRWEKKHEEHEKQE